MPEAPVPTREAGVRITPGANFALDGGTVLHAPVQHVTLYGKPRTDGSNVVLVPHALTGSSRVADWWPGVVGPGCLIDTERLCVVGINALGGCYGSTGPASPASDGRPYGSRFPVLTVRDIVRAQRLALRELGIERIAAVIGGSLGGMQALAWGIEAPDAVELVVAIGASGALTPLSIGVSSTARAAIAADPNFHGGDYYDGAPPAAGLDIARRLGMLTYKSEPLLLERFGRRNDRKGGRPESGLWARFDVEGYLAHQGEIFVDRMDANTHLVLSKAMELFDLDRDYGSTEDAGGRVLARTVLVGIENDWLFPAAQVHQTWRRLREGGADAAYLELASNHGHDAFLAEPESLTRLLEPVLAPLYARER
ncbi:homoserine O-acetyltransferase, partial [bacterium]